MQRLLLRGSTTELTLEQLWQRLSEVHNYPQYVKFCRRITAIDLQEGGHYSDTTTLLWVPITVPHHITSFKPGRQIQYYLRLPGGGEMWQSFDFYQDGEAAGLTAEVRFHLGNPVWTHTVGRVLCRRLKTMFVSVVPEITEFTHINQ